MLVLTTFLVCDAQSAKDVQDRQLQYVLNGCLGAWEGCEVGLTVCHPSQAQYLWGTFLEALWKFLLLELESWVAVAIFLECHPPSASILIIVKMWMYYEDGC